MNVILYTEQSNVYLTYIILYTYIMYTLQGLMCKSAMSACLIQ